MSHHETTRTTVRRTRSPVKTGITIYGCEQDEAVLFRQLAPRFDVVPIITEANRIVGTTALCAALERAREGAAALGFGLLLWDGYRPQRAVECFVHWSRQPEDGRTKRRHYPNINRAEMLEQGYVAAKSGHSRGSTVDLTLYQLATGELVPMGGDHDLMDPVSHHGAQGITQVATRNRQHLCSIMEACGFSAYDCEWWHYKLKDEPYPRTYFDFPVA